MVIDDNGAIRIICLQVRETPAGYAERVLWNIHVYDFVANTWRMHSEDLPGRRLEFCVSATFLNDSVYLIAKCQYGHQIHNIHRLFRVYTRCMVEMPINFTDGILMVQVFQYRGTLMLMTGTEEPRKEPCRVRLWEYDDVSESWESLVSMPHDIVDAFYQGMSGDGGFFFDIEGDICCFANRLESQYIVMYHFVRKEWWHVSCSDMVLDDFEKLRVQWRITFLWQPRIDIFL